MTSQAAALRRPLRPESAYDDMTALSHRRCDIADVSKPFLCGCQEVENRAVMPDIEGTRRDAGLHHISV